MNRARYVIVDDDFLKSEPLVIRDIGPWDQHPSVTNDAEAVIEELAAAGNLPNGRRLFYFDSEGQKDELIHENGRFVRFAPGPQKGGAA